MNFHTGEIASPSSLYQNLVRLLGETLVFVGTKLEELSNFTALFPRKRISTLCIKNQQTWFSVGKIVMIAAISILAALPSQVKAQQLSERQAKAAVHMVVKHSGLVPNFTVRENLDVKTAVAYIKNRERFIEYNPQIIASIVDSTETNWAAVSILAHEIAHHLLGHTLDPGKISPGDELACDKYSGFILHRMGATDQDAIAAIKVAGSTFGTKTHPPKYARVEAILQGWNESSDLLAGRESVTPVVDLESYHFVLSFKGDDHTYYINEMEEVVWYNNYAEPIVFGKFLDADSKSYVNEITWDDNRFYVDHKGKVWNITTYNVMMEVGEISALE